MAGAQGVGAYSEPLGTYEGRAVRAVAATGGRRQVHFQRGPDAALRLQDALHRLSDYCRGVRYHGDLGDSVWKYNHARADHDCSANHRPEHWTARGAWHYFDGRIRGGTRRVVFEQQILAAWRTAR